MGSTSPGSRAAARARAGADAGLAVRARDSGDDMHVEIAVDVLGNVGRSEQTVFRGGEIGRRRAATTACAALWTRLGELAAVD